MTLSLFLKGIVIGLSIAMPVGPIGILCIRNSFLCGVRFGLLSGLGAAFADALYGAVAGFGVITIISFLTSYLFLLKIIGGIFLCYLGYRTLCKKKTPVQKEDISQSSSRIFFTTFFLTLTNPLTIFSFIAIYAGLGLEKHADFMCVSLLTLGVFFGSCLWWSILCNSAVFFKNKLHKLNMKSLDYLSGVTLTGFGIFSFFA